MLKKFLCCFSFDKRRFLFGLLIAAALVPACFLLSSIKGGIILAVFFLILGAATLRVESPRMQTAVYTAWVLCCTVVAVMIASGMMRSAFFYIEPLRLLLNILAVLGVYALVFVFTGNVRRSVIIGSLILTLLSTANFFVYQFRGKELCALDFLSLSTAFTVAQRYTPQFTAPLLYGWTMLLGIVFSATALPPPPKLRKPSAARISALIFAICTPLILWVGSRDIPIKNFPAGGTHYNGFYLNFFLGIRDAFITEPDGYSLQAVEQLEQQYPSDAPVTAAKRPNIIVIMNESFGDPGVFDTPPVTNVPVTPFLDSLHENAVKGHALSSVLGGNTANSEFEFLTGNSLAFLPSGSVPYQQYITKETYTITRHLRSLGYTDLATHPLGEKGWFRYKIYPLFGFTRSTFIDDYPQQDLIRTYVSDREMYRYIVQQMRSKKDGAPFYLFGITMQNHGGYTYVGDDCPQTVKLEGYDKSYPATEQYLSLIRESDSALQELLTQLEQYPEDTVVLFFGDHLPNLDDGFYSQLLNGADDLRAEMKKHTVPFFIWANYDIPEQTVEMTSLNFLGRLLLETAGLPLPSYQNFLSDVQQVIPAMNALGYYSVSQQDYISYAEAEGTEAEWLKRYDILQHNGIFEKTPSKVFFPIAEER